MHLDFLCSLKKEIILKAVNLGEDTDTIGAISGGLAGIEYGIDSFPKSWLNDLRKKELIEEVSKIFFNSFDLMK